MTSIIIFFTLFVGAIFLKHEAKSVETEMYANMTPEEIEEWEVIARMPTKVCTEFPCEVRQRR